MGVRASEIVANDLLSDHVMFTCSYLEEVIPHILPELKVCVGSKIFSPNSAYAIQVPLR